MRVAEDIVDRFRAAAVGMDSWAGALQAFGESVNGHAAQLGGFDQHGDLVLNIMANVSAEEVAAYHTHGGADPVVNIRNHAVIHGRPLQCLTEEDFASPDLIARSAIYRDLFIPYEVQHACMVRLHGEGELPTAVALLRSGSQGHADRDERRFVEAVVPGLSGAVRTARLLGRGTEAAILATAETLAGPTLLLGTGLKIVSLSPAAEVMVQAGTHLSIRRGRLIARSPVTAAALEAAFTMVTAPGGNARGNVSLTLQGMGNTRPLPGEMAPMPMLGTGAIGQARALLTLRDNRPAPRAAAMLASAHGLTPAETAIALLLADGLTVSAIADRRGSTISTVRNQIKSLFAKTDTSRQAELVLKVGSYGRPSSISGAQ